MSSLGEGNPTGDHRVPCGSSARLCSSSTFPGVPPSGAATTHHPGEYFNELPFLPSHKETHVPLLPETGSWKVPEGSSLSRALGPCERPVAGSGCRPRRQTASKKLTGAESTENSELRGLQEPGPRASGSTGFLECRAWLSATAKEVSQPLCDPNQ